MDGNRHGAYDGGAFPFPRDAATSSSAVSTKMDRLEQRLKQLEKKMDEGLNYLACLIENGTGGLSPTQKAFSNQNPRRPAFGARSAEAQSAGAYDGVRISSQAKDRSGSRAPSVSQNYGGYGGGPYAFGGSRGSAYP